MLPNAAPPTLRKQQGSIIVPVVASLLVGLILLGAAQLGYLFLIKRELQKAADLAALSGAQQLTQLDCTAALAAASQSIDSNQPGGIGMDAPQLACGHWEPPVAGTPPGADPRYFEARPAGPFNAVQVVLTAQVPRLIPFVLGEQQRVQAEAIARRDDPTASFSVASRLLRLDDSGLVTQLLGAVGLTPNRIDVLSASGLADARITPSGLLQALGLPATVVANIGSPDELLQLEQVTLGDLLQAYATVLSNTEGVANAAVSALDGLIADLNLRLLDNQNPLTLPVSLFGPGGIFAEVSTDDPAAALHTRVNVLDLISTSLLVANGDRLLDLPSLDVLGAVQARVRVIDPPQIALGGRGGAAVTPQVRVYVRINTDSIPLVGGLLGVLGTTIDVPLIVEVGRSEARLENLCEAPLARNEAQIDVISSAARVCLGSFPHMGPGFGADSFFSDHNTCSAFDEATVPERHAIVSVLGILRLNSRINLPVIDSGTESVVLTAPEPGVEPDIVTVSPAGNIDLSRQVQAVLDQVGGGLLDDLLGSSAGVSSIGPGGINETVDYLFGPTAAGRSLTEIAAEVRYSGQALADRGRVWSSGAIVNALLGEVGALLDVVLLAPLGDVVCGVGGGLVGGAQGIRNCKTPYVRSMLEGRNGVTTLLSHVLLEVLDPVLDILGRVLQVALRDVLGVTLGQTDLSLHSVRCGEARLVY